MPEASGSFGNEKLPETDLLSRWSWTAKDDLQSMAKATGTNLIDFADQRYPRAPIPVPPTPREATNLPIRPDRP